MATVTTYTLTITQTRPDTDTKWYDLNSFSWQYAWGEFNKYDEEVTEIVDGITTTKLERRLKYPLTTFINNSNDELTRTRIYRGMIPAVHDEFVALLDDDSSALGDEKRHAELYAITYQRVSEENVIEVLAPVPAVEDTAS